MRKFGIGILVVCLYSFPYVYFSMYQDFAQHLMLGYLIMIIVTSLLAFFSIFFCNIIPILIGNIVSAILSYTFIAGMDGVENWDTFFKPLTPNELFLFVSFFNLLPQLIAIALAHRHLKKNNRHN
ncbi:hypothetical protein [Lederbergia galactosidilytica]|uniref:Uncharacterized protein n=1 Tax=Lederbergia galactosidilytica TaxID=217031 RepID=A0A178A6M7_9BACI|nr:hypothetical protein [Lederbergia galactosidilytica]MBP1916211.1 xanthine/uracil permease [Lederbergia galactosidilytica]OAK75845.1 hypothetical protein ABB05_00170 [Lederbergia galactosidilytica]